MNARTVFATAVLTASAVLSALAQTKPGEMPPLPLRSGIGDYLAQTGKAYPVYPPSYYKGADDDADKLAKDAAIAVEAYEYLTRKKVTFEDKQSFVSFDFYMKTGDARFNPNAAQTSKLQSAIAGHLSNGKVVQADLIYEGLVATGGNLTLAFGSLAELFCWNRNDYIPKVADMSNADGKNYYRYAGAFIGLHSGVVRALGAGGSWANMTGNPIVYAGAEVIQWWGDFLKGKPTKGVDTLKTLGPEGRGNLVDKGGELHKGLDAAEKLRKQFSVNL
ncbi:MAG: hypothetical protein HY924_04090 [Elusimicrobia bacterium]|nr:hypothetical protein [Elusimicrobiota bacterium]